MLKKLPLHVRFTAMLAAVFGVVLIATVAVLYVSLSRLAEREIQEQAYLLTEMMNAVRDYTNEDITPLLAADLAVADLFIPETVPAHAAREVFERVRAQGEFADFFYKEATLNPTNPRDQADAFEAELVANFRRDPTLTVQTGERRVDGRRLVYEARPLSVGSASCLACHGDPANAPSSLIATYGSAGGFGWEVGEVVAAQTMYVPGTDIEAVAWTFVRGVVPVVLLAFALVLLLVNRLLRRAVVEPVGVLSTLAATVAKQDVDDEVLGASDLQRVMRRDDELGQLASVFQQMVREVARREQVLKEQVQELRIVIDETRKEKEVAEIVEDEGFQALQERARKLRARRGRRQAQTEDSSDEVADE